VRPGIEIEARAAGLYLPALDLYLDPQRDVPRAFISHAHGDHIAAHRSGLVLASRETLALIEARRGERGPGAQALEWGDAVDLPVAGGAPSVKTARVSIAPAGHILGAAQLVVDLPGGRVVYTGDYRTGPGATHATGAPVACDVLVLESTFALPMFRFPDRAATRAALVDWCAARLAAGETPVVVAYALGKSQDLVHALLERDLPVIAHGAVYKMCAAYEALGVPLGVADGRLRAYADEKARAKLGAVLMAPPRSHPMYKKRKDARVAYASGWALIDAAVEQQRADAAFVLSDHADFDDLMATARATGARHVYTTHGDAAVLAALLRRDGIAATPLELPALDQGEEQGQGEEQAQGDERGRGDATSPPGEEDAEARA
jgi:putative mRNA 3-end processing factor